MYQHHHHFSNFCIAADQYYYTSTVLEAGRIEPSHSTLQVLLLLIPSDCQVAMHLSIIHCLSMLLPLHPKSTTLSLWHEAITSTGGNEVFTSSYKKEGTKKDTLCSCYPV